MTHLQSAPACGSITDLETQPSLEVALLTWEYAAIPSAGGHVASEVAHALADHGANVRVFTMDSDTRAMTDHERIEVIGCAGRITGMRRIAHYISGLDLLASASAFRDCLLEEHERRPFDIIESTSQGGPAAMLLGEGLPIVIRTAAPQVMEQLDLTGMSARLSSAIASGLEAKCIAGADMVISNSPAHAAAVRDWYGMKPGQPHQITPVSVNPGLANQGRKAPYPPAHARLRLARIGDASARTSFMESLAAFDLVLRALREKGKPLPELHLIGLDDGTFDEARRILGLDEVTANQIFDHGQLRETSTGHVLARCHFVLAPWRLASTGAAYQQAAAFGRPLILSAEDPTAKDFIERHQCGVVAANSDPENIAQAILELEANRPMQLKMRAAGRSHAERWTRQALGARTLQAYRRALKLEEINLPGLVPAQGTALVRSRFA